MRQSARISSAIRSAHQAHAAAVEKRGSKDAQSKNLYCEWMARNPQSAAKTPHDSPRFPKTNRVFSGCGMPIFGGQAELFPAHTRLGVARRCFHWPQVQFRGRWSDCPGGTRGQSQFRRKDRPGMNVGTKVNNGCERLSTGEQAQLWPVARSETTKVWIGCTLNEGRIYA